MRLTGLEANQAVSAAECVRGAGHRLDGDASPLDVRQTVAREDHQVLVALAGPECRPVPEAHPGSSVVVALEVGEAVVESQLSDPLWHAKVELRALDPVQVDGDSALVRVQDSASGNLQRHLVDPTRVDGEIGMRAGAVRTCFFPDVGCLGPHRQAVVGQYVFHSQVERERKARLRMERVPQDDSVGLALGDDPGGPAHKTMNGVAALRLVERKLLGSAVELVAAVRDPVRPRDQELAAP